MSTDQPQPADANYSETLVCSQQEFFKEQLDIALAAQILHSGLLSERELLSAISVWTIYGSVPLSEHLVKLGLLDSSTQQRLSQEAASRLAELCPEVEGNGAASQSVLINTLDAIDPSGAVARLLGIRGVAGAGATDATGTRSATGNYRLMRKIGQGGLGRVWLAFDEHLRRHVAVKEITAKQNTAALDRFRREAEITGRLEHPGIVPIYQLGNDTDTGEAFYAMRFLGKTTLHDAILEYHERRSAGEDDPMLIRRLLTDFVSICQAIGHAHSRKVIHRDLKPENIAIDNFGQVIVIDWGIAKVIDELNTTEGQVDPLLAAGSDRSTIQGQVLGTPLYMSPEQAAGRIDELDERTDIYGLGAILFSILTGYAPHERTRNNSSESGERNLLSAIASHPTPNPLESNSSVDPALGAICRKAMAHRQYARYETASQLADEVQRWMAGEPVSAYREKPSQRIARWIQHHRIWSQVIGGLLIVGIVALATLGIAARQSRLAAKQILFDEMRGYEREIEVQLKATAEDLAEDARFMSTLPPIQGIISAQAGAADSEGEDVWRQRLEVIFTGLLRANSDYLAVSYTAASDTEEGVDIVRIERSSSHASYVRSVPSSRLQPFGDKELLANTTALPPRRDLTHDPHRNCLNQIISKGCTPRRVHAHL